MLVKFAEILIRFLYTLITSVFNNIYDHDNFKTDKIHEY